MSPCHYWIGWYLLLVLMGGSLQAQNQIQERVYSSKYREANRLVELAMESMEGQHYKEAMSLLNQALQIQTDHIDAYFNRALTKEKLEDPQGALTDYQIVLLIDSTYREAAFNRAKLRHKQKQYQRAITDFKKVLTMSSGETRMLYFKGTPIIKNGEVPIQGIATTYSLDADIHNFIGLCYHAMENFDASVLSFNEALSINPIDANYYVNRGLSEASRGNSKKALMDFRAALSLVPEHPIAQFNLTQELESSGNLGLAAYDEIIEHNPKFASAYVNRALAKMNTGNINGALEDYNQAIALDPNDQLFYVNRALAYEKKKNFRAALADYNVALRLNPNGTISYRGRGRVLFKLEEFQLSLEDMDEAIRLDPKHGGSFFNRALVHQKIGNLDQTCADLEQAKEMGVKMASNAFKSYCYSAN